MISPTRPGRPDPRRFFVLPAADRPLVVAAAAAYLTFWVALRLLPFLAVRRLAERGRAAANPARVSTARIAWAVDVVERLAGGRRNCLVAALAARALLGRYGHRSQLGIGVRRGEDGHLRAHAWVETDGTVLVGPTDEHYVLIWMG